MKKNILILANSARESGRCIAGIEVTEIEGSTFRAGQWIRPVTHKGAVPPRVSTVQWSEKNMPAHYTRFQRLIAQNTQPKMLDVLSVSFLDSQPIPPPYQPENQLIDESEKWQKIETVDPAALTNLVEAPSSIWSTGGRSDRIRESQATGSVRPFQSLYLIRPTELRFRIWENDDAFRGRPHKNRRAIFMYAGAEYNLPITDPTMDARYFRPFPALNQQPKEIAPKNPANCLLVVSLAAPFKDGYHYKVVATILEY